MYAGESGGKIKEVTKTICLALSEISDHTSGSLNLKEIHLVDTNAKVVKSMEKDLMHVAQAFNITCQQFGKEAKMRKSHGIFGTLGLKKKS